MDSRVKVVRIKAGVVKRVSREASAYRREAEAQRVKCEEAEKSENADPHVVRHNRRLLEEALMMVPDADRRLKKAHSDLKDILDLEQDIRDTEDYKVASTILEDTSKQLSEYEPSAL